jgi:hypothetical protein
MNPPRLLLFGSRTWTSEGLIGARLARFPRGTVVIHGDAEGADTIGGRMAKALGFEVIAEPAIWRVEGVYNPKAGPERNQRMIDLHHPTCGLGFHEDIGLGKGSKDMARRLWTAGLPVDLVIRPVKRKDTPHV